MTTASALVRPPPFSLSLSRRQSAQRCKNSKSTTQSPAEEWQPSETMLVKQQPQGTKRTAGLLTRGGWRSRRDNCVPGGGGASKGVGSLLSSHEPNVAVHALLFCYPGRASPSLRISQTPTLASGGRFREEQFHHSKRHNRAVGSLDEQLSTGTRDLRRRRASQHGHRGT